MAGAIGRLDHHVVWDRIMTQAAAPATPSGIVLAVNGYYGYREASIREWLAAKRRVGNGS